MVSSRIPADLPPHPLTAAVRAARACGRVLIDLTESNPTRAAFDYPPDLLAPLGDARGLCYAPSPLGMAGKEPLQIDLTPLKQSAVVYDVIYVPLETGLLAQAKNRGHRTVDGLGMLLQQAGFGFRKWFCGNPQVTAELRAMLEADIVAKTPK